MYALWADRLNWPEWFHMIEEVGFKEGEEDMCALNMWYRFGERGRAVPAGAVSRGGGAVQGPAWPGAGEALGMYIQSFAALSTPLQP